MARYTFVRLMSHYGYAWVDYTLRSPKVVVIEAYKARPGGYRRRAWRRVVSRERARQHMALLRESYGYRVSRRNPEQNNPPDAFFDKLLTMTPTAAAHAMIVKFGIQAAGWAKTIRSSCRNKTAESFWRDVCGEAERIIYKRNPDSDNPASHAPVISYATAHRWEPLAKAKGVSAVARSGRGFMRAYQRAGTWAQLDSWWKNRRNAFVARHMAQVRLSGEALWKKDRTGKMRPSRRCLALLMWAFMPPGRR